MERFPGVLSDDEEYSRNVSPAIFSVAETLGKQAFSRLLHHHV
jgi:hypothetical protein